MGLKDDSFFHVIDACNAAEVWLACTGEYQEKIKIERERERERERESEDLKRDEIETEREGDETQKECMCVRE